ncbi:hypothetical protein ACU4HD_44470, partial [Cupriavidus basilensis]
LPAMLGALFQLLPVVAGVPVRGARWVSPWVALWCVATASALATGFLGASHRAFVLAAWLGAPLLAVPAALIAVAGMRVVQTRATHATVRTLRRIGWALLATLASGATLATALASGWFAPSPGCWLCTCRVGSRGLAGNVGRGCGLDRAADVLADTASTSVLASADAVVAVGAADHWGVCPAGRAVRCFWQTWGWLALAALAMAGVRAVCSRASSARSGLAAVGWRLPLLGWWLPCWV